MIGTISKLAQINANKTNNNLRFNGSLPISITVLKSLGLDRYKLLLGTKNFTTKSQRKLEHGAKYWGSFGEGKNGIVTISNLIKKPTFLQNEEYFLDIECTEFLSQIIQVESPISTFKEWILENLEKEETKKTKFSIFTQMLLALKEGIIHLPLKQEGNLNILQLKTSYNQTEFYCAFENLGPMVGSFKNGILNLEVYFNKTQYFLTKQLNKSDIVSNIIINKQIEPFFSFDKLILDLKG